MRRRQFLAGGASAGAIALAAAAPAPQTAAPPPEPFDPQSLRARARALAAQAYKPPEDSLPAGFGDLTYDQYRAIRFDPAQALWRGQDLQWQAQFFHRGFLFRQRVDLFEVADGRARPIAYRPDLFSFPPGLQPPSTDIGFSGFRLHAPINTPGVFDEVAVFQGASYFRAVGRGLQYGLSARGLALGTADPAGEEFPAFRAFWIERPPPASNLVVVNALIDSPSAACAMRASIRPGPDTVMDVELVVYPRTDLDKAGIAAGTSMFLFDGNAPGIDDWRRAVHDSDGLMMLTGRGEQLWRPLANPRTLQVSGFADAGPRGFGLMQRARDFRDYGDIEARYERRPGLWVEPIGDWGEGTVTLVEIPTRSEIHDNIVAFWRPRAPLRARGEHGFTYRLHWCAEPPVPVSLARFRHGVSGASAGGRAFVLEAAGGPVDTLPAEAPLRLQVEASKGQVANPVVIRNPDEGSWRASFELQPGDEPLIELRALLLLGDKPMSETWLYRWVR